MISFLPASVPKRRFSDATRYARLPGQAEHQQVAAAEQADAQEPSEAARHEVRVLLLNMILEVG